MVGKRIDEILASKANNNSKNGGNSYFSPIVVPVVSSFKRIYKTRLSRNAVFKGKPLHTIEESSETAQNELNILNNLAWDQNDNCCDYQQEDDDVTLSQIRHLFEMSENGCFVDNDTLLDDVDNCCHFDLSYKDSTEDERSLQVSSSTSPSVSLMQQFELAAKVEAATCIQRWYRQVRQRRKFLQMRQSAILIQRYFKKRR